MIVVMMGVAGSGKTTVGELLANELGWKFYDADDYHPAANVEKMRRGIPLTDEDRKPWLQSQDLNQPGRHRRPLHREHTRPQGQPAPGDVPSDQPFSVGSTLRSGPVRGTLFLLQVFDRILPVF
jgi:hypothetical protein